MEKNKGIVFLTGLTIVLGIVVGYLWFQVKNVRQQVLMPEFLRQTSIVAGEIDWNLKNFQPVIKGFLTENGQNFMLVKFIDQSGQEKEAKLFVSGKTPSGYSIEEIVFQPAEGEAEKLTFTQLKKQLKKGTQIRAEYINAVPELLNVTDCGTVTENLRKLCFLTDVLVSQQFKQTLEDELKSGDQPAPLIPITSLSLKLYEN